MDKLLTVTDICERYSVSRYTVYRWTSAGSIPFIKIGGLIRFRLDDLIKWEEKKLIEAPITKLL